jgi:hypothetical protein
MKRPAARGRRWWLAAPILIAALGGAYAISATVMRPYLGGQLPIGGSGSQPARVGQTVFMDLAIPAHRDGAHITGVHADNVSPGLAVKFVSTTFARTSENNLAGYPLSCATPASVSPVAGTPLTAATYLRLELTATKTGQLGFTGITVDWADGLLHGSATSSFQYEMRATNGPGLACPGGRPAP